MKNNFLRKRDLLVIRIADWRHDKYCKGIDIEIYRKGKYIRKGNLWEGFLGAPPMAG